MTESREAIRHALQQVPDSEVAATLAHDALIQIGNRVIDLAEQECRDLNDWEKANLAEAIGFLAIGWIDIAWTDLDLAVCEPSEIAPNAVSQKEAAALSKFDIPRFRRALADIAAGPARRL